MAEHICPITKDLCLRPGEALPGGSDISHEGYCGGIKLADGICHTIPGNIQILFNKVTGFGFKRQDSHTVCVLETPEGQGENLIARIVDGKLIKY